MIRKICGMVFTVTAEDGYAQPGRRYKFARSQRRASGAVKVPLRVRQDGRLRKPYGHSGQFDSPADLRRGRAIRPG